jgi:DNA polymerase I
MQVAQWQDRVRSKAKEDVGFHRVQTMIGRHRMLPGYGKGNTSKEEAQASRAAINTPIQGSAADVVAAAMVRIQSDPVFERLGWKMLLQVHDEVRYMRSYLSCALLLT